MIALITGASRGIGRETAIKFAKNGWDVIINYKENETKVNELKNYIESDYKVNAYAIKCNISNEVEVKKMYQYIKDNIGSIDCLVNNAGIAKDNELMDKTIDEFMEVVSVNLGGMFLMLKYVRMVMDEGSIINISSTNGIDTTYIESVDYDASKAGVISLSNNFAKVYSPKIRVNTVAPGWVNTDMNKDLSDSFKQAEIDKIMLGFIAEPSDIANVVYFLASSEARYINNAIIRVDGGIYN